MSAEATKTEVTGQPSVRRSALTEGILLALSPAVAYAVAFIYELGYADHFGYPSWMIEVSWINVLWAWLILLCAVFIAVFLVFFLGQLLPASAASFFRNGFSWLLGMALLFGLVAWTLMASPKWYFEGVLLSIVAGTFMYALLAQLYLNYLKTRKDDSRTTRLGAAFRMFDITAGATTAQQMSLTDAFLKRQAFGRPLSAFGGWLLLWSLLAVVPAHFVGHLEARFPGPCFVTHELRDWVAIRKYGDNILAMPLDLKNMTVTPDFTLFPLADTTRVWSRRPLCRLSVPSLDIQ